WCVFSSQITKGRGSCTRSFTHDFTPCPTRMAPPRMANNTSAARRRKRRHHRNQAQSSTCVIIPQGWVTVSVIQYKAFSHVSFCPGFHIQPENQTIRGITSNTAAPAAVRLAIESMSSPFSLSTTIITEFPHSGGYVGSCV